jgi:hypothetical protein
LLDDPSNVSCKESTQQYPVDDPLLSCKQQVGGSSPPASSQNGRSQAYSLTLVGCRSFRCQILIDLARGYAMRRMDAAAVNTLLDAEQVAAEAVRFNVLVHELLRELLKREHVAASSSG